MKKGQQAKNLFTIVMTIGVTLIISTSASFSVEIPRFFGIYILQNGQYMDVPRYQMENIEYNIRKRMMGKDCNIKAIIPREHFVMTEKDIFNQEGFLVHQDSEWSDFRLFRVPYKGKFSENEKQSQIVTNIRYGCGVAPGVQYSSEGLEQEMNPVEIRLRKAKVGEDAYIYVPAEPVEAGFYLIDYKKNGQGFYGYNPIRLIQEVHEITEEASRLYYEKWEHEKAITLWQQASDKGDAEAQMELAWLYATSIDSEYQDSKKAVTLALQALSQKQDEWVYHDTLAAAYARDGQFNKAVEEQKKAISLYEDKKDVDINKRLQLYMNQQPFELYYGKLPYKVTDRANFLYGNPNVNCNKAIQLWEIAARQEDARAFMMLAWHYATFYYPQYHDGTKAINLAKKALEMVSQQPDNVDAWEYFDTLAAAYARNNQFEKAIEEQKKAIMQLKKSNIKEDRLKNLIKEANERLNLYTQQKAYINSYSRSGCSLD